MNREEFIAALGALADAWSGDDPASGVEVFTDDAVYMEPPDIQLFRGREELSAYFGAVQPGTYLRFHNLWFDEVRQVGAAEFTFGVAGRNEAHTGVAIIEVRDGLFVAWREYQRAGSASFAEFTSPEGKEWEWHIGNYP